ncbi:hypothetical protein KUT41_18985 [Pseudomonas aeruginosa]|jgi:hypothetical protein|uniref:Uncharacterized protein n=4 Tax=Pseudomonas TaxID=286 RepID=Q88IM9_PSEPK|nr:MULTISPECIES: hypothetical protein [Pseudomonas]ANN45342.1 hypothetical protein [uncultured bacterium]MDP9214092.1 hypothetical protein [Pseudomonadota bacterium]OZB33637.1 MAG: hypothetical protein B7X51_03310 [Pseudomonas sp. 34-62-33]AAN68578.1 conserved exported protein of unknown function [Pseudomonas putida KT2440]ANN45411.1 hypothetical protein [uncultured bacterium]
MLSNPISTKVIFALALAILIAWAGHTSALFMGSSQPVGSGNNGAHSHTHGDEALACAAYGDHCHSPLTADHVHETPHLTTLLSISTLPERTQPIPAPRYSIPPSPIFLIERPPRATFVL